MRTRLIAGLRARAVRPTLALGALLTLLAALGCSTAAVEFTPVPTNVGATAPPVRDMAAPTPPPKTDAQAPTANGAPSPPFENSVGLPGIYEKLTPSGPKEASPFRYNQSLPQDAIRPIYAPTISTPEEASLDSEDLVIGVKIGGESRAYPIRPLRFREMVNDELGGVPILVTW